MSAREIVLASVRRSLGVTGGEATRRQEVVDRLARHAPSVIPARGQLPPQERLDLFNRMVEAAAATLEFVPHPAGVPGAVSAYLRAKNLPMQIRRGEDARLEAMPWADERALEVSKGPSDGQQLVSVSHAFAGVAETGTLILLSGPENPTTLNFLPDTQIVVIDANDVAGDFEAVWRRLRETRDVGAMPRVVNMVTGPSRSADIEQKLILGAHGPRQLHVVVVGESPRRK